MGTHSTFRNILIRAACAAVLVLLWDPIVQHATAARQRDQVRRQIGRVLRDFETTQVDIQTAVRRVREVGEFRFASRGEFLDVVLEPYDLRAPGYMAQEETATGRQLIVDNTPVRTYRGTAPGLGKSDARFTIRDGSLEGVVLTPDEWYYIEPLRNYTPDADPSEMVVYRRSDIIPEALGQCGTGLAHRVGEALDLIEPRMSAANGGVSVADIATEADYEFVSASGGAGQANAAILDILNQVDGIYQAELSVSLRVVYQHAWSTPDDPYSSTASGTIIGEFMNYWNANFGSVDCDLVHMWTGKDMDGSVVGIAYVGSVCYARSYSYGVSQRITGSPAKYILTAHEIGHNFGASHSDGTDCTNTIMNSSVGTGFTFCAFSRSEIGSFVSSHSSCLATAAYGVPTITGFSPSTGRPGTVVTISGTNLSGATSVKFNGVSASSYTVTSASQITATVPAAATTGRIGVTTPGGTADSVGTFRVARCDINGDGVTNVLDIQLAINSILGIPGAPGSCDINGDGITNVLDLQLLANVVLGIASCPG